MIRPGSVYSLHPSYAMEKSSLENLPRKTGKTLEEWIAHLRTNGPRDESAARSWLKQQHPAVGMNFAGWIVECAEGKGLASDYDPDAMVEEMFAKKPALVPLYETLLHLVLSLGSDVKACPCQTIVPFYRGNVFAQLKPSTKTRLDLGLCLRGCDSLPPRLIDTGGLAKGDRITHRISVSSDVDIDDELKKWLSVAYGSTV